MSYCGAWVHPLDVFTRAQAKHAHDAWPASLRPGWQRRSGPLVKVQIACVRPMFEDRLDNIQPAFVVASQNRECQKRDAMWGGDVGVAAFTEAVVDDVDASSLDRVEDSWPALVSIRESQLEQVAGISIVRHGTDDKCPSSSPLIGRDLEKEFLPHLLGSWPSNPHGEVRWCCQILLPCGGIERRCSPWQWGGQQGLARVSSRR